MSAVDDLLRTISIPRVVEVRQCFPAEQIDSVEDELRSCFADAEVSLSLGGRRSVALAVGSRGIGQLPLIVKTVVAELRRLGARPFIVPAMGSHGGATAEGQRRILEGMGVTERYIGAPIRASMATVQVATTRTGLPVFMDRLAREADATIVINRIQPHVSFRSKYESGLMKMVAIGLGKLEGANVCHDLGFGSMHRTIPEIGLACLARSNITHGIAILENAYHQPYKIAMLRKHEIEISEPALLESARKLQPRILFDTMDVLVISEIGKNISGSGCDTNIIGRYGTPFASGGPTITKIAVLDITEVSHGNCTGVGLADFTTRRLFEKFSFESTYPNSLTSTVQASIKIPMVLKDARQAVQAAIKTCNIRDKARVRLVWIRNTSQLDTIKVSESLLNEVRGSDRLEIAGESGKMRFDSQGNALW